MTRILTDVDGVLLKWEEAFHAWMYTHGHKRLAEAAVTYSMESMYDLESSHIDVLVREFNESHYASTIEPLGDSVEVVAEMVEDGYHFEAITSMSLAPCAAEFRRQNLDRYFPGAVSKIRCLDIGAPKDEVLKEYESSWWLEDRPENCEAGLAAGHRVIIVEHEWNRYYENSNVYRVKNWKEIKEIIYDNP